MNRQLAGILSFLRFGAGIGGIGCAGLFIIDLVVSWHQGKSHDWKRNAVAVVIPVVLICVSPIGSRIFQRLKLKFSRNRT